MAEKMETGSVIKVVFIGDSDVGKTSLVLRFTEEKFSDSNPSTVGVEFNTRVIQIDGKVLFLQMWDTAGQERYRAIIKGYFRDTHGIFFVYDITNRESLKGLKSWVEEVDSNCTNSKCVKILLGNKKDQESSRKISYDEGLELAQKFNMEYYETSALDGVGIDKAMNRMVKLVIKRNEGLVTPHQTNVKLMKRKESPRVQKKKCCEN